MKKEDFYIRFNDVTVSLLELRVWFREKELSLSLRELRLLVAFLEEPYQTISREELIRRVDLMSGAALQTMICRLRSVFDHRYIVTHHELGHSFVRISFEMWKSHILDGVQDDTKAN